MQNGCKKSLFYEFGSHSGKTKYFLLLYYIIYKHVLQIYTASVPEQTILRDYYVYSYSGIWSIQ